MSHNDGTSLDQDLSLPSSLTTCSYTTRDVLLVALSPQPPPHDGAASPFRLLSGRSYIGSNRLQVLCDMHRAKVERAEKEEQQQNENDSETVAAVAAAAKEIVDIVQRDYQAKFVLVNTSKQQQNDPMAADPNDSSSTSLSGFELTSQLAQEFVQMLLTKPPDEEKTRDSGVLSELPTGVTAESSGALEHATPIVRSDKVTIDNNDDDAKKRRRRSSLLRRSVTEDGQAISMKKSIQNFRALFGGATGAASIEPESAKYVAVDAIEPLDVIFDAMQSALAKCDISNDATAGIAYAGNNRLDVLCSIKEQPFQAASPEQKEATLEELYQTVTEFWGGRFLAEPQQEQPTTGRNAMQKWHVLDKEAAKLGLTRLLDPNSAPSPLAAVSSAATSNSTTTRRPSLLRLKNPLPGLDFLSIRPPHAPPSSTSVPVEHDDKLRSAAVASLQRRKKRQGLTSKIRSLTTNLLSGKAGNAGAVKQQQDRFAEANFDTAPPNMMRAMSERDEYGGGGDDYNNSSAPVGRRASMSRTPSQEGMPPPPRRQVRRGDFDESFGRRGSSQSFNGSFNQRNSDEALYNHTHDDSHDELAEIAQQIAPLDDDEDDDGGMLAILQRQLLSKAAAEAAEIQRQPQLLAAPVMMMAPEQLGTVIPLETGEGVAVQYQAYDSTTAPFPAQLGLPHMPIQPYRDNYHAVMPTGPIHTLPVMVKDDDAGMATIPVTLAGFTEQGYQQQQQQQAPSIEPAGSSDLQNASAKARMSGRFSGIGELEDGQLEALLNGLDVSESDLNYDSGDETQQQAQV